MPHSCRVDRDEEEIIALGLEEIERVNFFRWNTIYMFSWKGNLENSHTTSLV